MEYSELVLGVTAPGVNACPLTSIYFLTLKGKMTSKAAALTSAHFSSHTAPAPTSLNAGAPSSAGRSAAKCKRVRKLVSNK